MTSGKRESPRDQTSKPKPGRSSNFRSNQGHSTMSFANVQQGKKTPFTVGSEFPKQVRILQNEKPKFIPNQLGQKGNTPRSCLFCNNRDHPLWKCPLTFQARLRTIMRSNRCTKCLQEGHFNANCKVESSRKCGASHHTFLHCESTQNNVVANKRHKSKW